MQDLYTAAELYDLVHLGPWKGELEFYQRQAARLGPRVLELACGTGRLTVPLAQHGLTMTGLDLSPAMLARARAKAAYAGAALELTQADMRAFTLGRRFDLIFIPINSLCHLLTRPDVEACFQCVRAHLEPHGRFIIDVFNPSFAILSRDSQRWYEIGEYPDAQGRRVRLSEQNRYDSATQINAITWRFETEGGPPQDLALAMRQFFPQELDALLAWHGFTLEAKYGKYGEKDFHADSTQQLIVARLT
ncbi:MAG: class I SAM-dependent methyltransferase [Anaerolineales bacterium]|nr:class I SAM-dependent methyltransferase [Anaerolineales bacterium]